MALFGFKCKRCGNCCINLDAYCTTASDADVELWKSEGREDILEWVATISLGENKYEYAVWFDPATGEQVTECPWLTQNKVTGEYACSIDCFKPTVCRNYPISYEHARATRCKGVSGKVVKSEKE